jgi:hypothetical protein
MQNDPANNPKRVVEAIVGIPGQSQAAFNDQVSNVMASKANTIRSAAFPTPDFCNADVRNDPACVFRGRINWPAYASCR